MAQNKMHGFLRHLCRAVFRNDSGDLTDGQLLERFLHARDEAAFEELVRRHGPMVLGVCRRVLHNVDDAEDAFQATFLVLARKASSIITRETVGSWLYGVAFRTSQKARALAARRRVKECQMSRPEALEEDVWREMRPLLDRELNRLPEKYRAPVVLCDIEGQTRKQAARRLGCPEGTLSARLSRARVLLAKQLARHGLTLSGGAVAVALSHNAASAGLPTPLVSSTVQAATLVVAGHATAGVVSAPVVALTEGVLQAMFRTKLKIAVGTALAIGMLAVGVGVYQSHAEQPGASEKGARSVFTSAPVPPAKDDVKAEGAKDGENMNLPKGSAPIQVLVSLDKDGKLVVKQAVANFRAFAVPGVPLAAPPGGALPVLVPATPAPAGGAPGALPAAPAVPAAPARVALPPGGLPAAPAVPARVVAGPAALPPGVQVQAGGIGVAGGAIQIANANTVQSTTYELDDVQVVDTKGKPVDKKELPKLLKEETVAMASLWGQPVDPLHLRVLKDGILTFVLPMPKPGAPGAAVFPAFPPGFQPAAGALPIAIPPAPTLPPGAAGAILPIVPPTPAPPAFVRPAPSEKGPEGL
jgi:RNA polymerase sigma factor (sigma-70 family)